MHRTEDAQQGGEGHDKQKLRFQLPLYCEQQKVDVEGEMLFEVQFICQVALQFIRQLANSMSVFLSFPFRLLSFSLAFLSFLLAFLFACFAVQWAERRGYSKSSSVPFPIDAVPFRVNDDRKKDLELFVYEKRLRKGGNPNPNPNPNPKSQLQPKLQLSSQSPLPPPPPDQEQPGAENPERTKPKPETGREGFDIFVKAEAALRGINVTD